MLCTIPLRENFTGNCWSEPLGGKTCHIIATKFFSNTQYMNVLVWTGECYTFQEISCDVINKSYPQQGRLSDNQAQIKRNTVDRTNECSPRIPNRDLHSFVFRQDK